MWIVAGILLAAVAWAVTSENPIALQVQETVGWKHDQSILEESFSVAPHNFQFYKFSLPEGSVNISVVGDFEVTSSKNGKEKDNTIEMYVLTESAFAVWQNGYATSSIYESGRVGSGTIDAQLPSGAGVYYLVFNNRYASKSAKVVHASALLRYKSWLPESLRVMKDRLWNWIGF